MKKGYKRILIFQTVIFLIFLLNSFVSNILGNYNIIILLVVALVLFKRYFGFERDRHRYIKDMMYDITIYLLIYFLLYYLLGIFIGFARTDNYYNFIGIKNFILPTVLFIILKEIFRYMMIVKSEGCKLLTITTYVLFVFLDITNALYYNKFGLDYSTFIFVALTFLPALTNNVLCMFLTTKSGYKPSMYYLLITQLYLYLLPIVPDPNEYLASIIYFILPVVLCYRIYQFFDKEKDEYKEREYKKSGIVTLGVATFLVTIMVYFTSGYFRFYSIAIASGSMAPSINKGDVVIVEKIGNNFDKLKKDQVVAYRYNGVVVVHRINSILKVDGKYYFYTKGDANNDVDNYAIEESMIIGVVNLRLPYVGVPTVALRDLMAK